MVDDTDLLLKELEEYAKEEKVPIMQPEGIKFLTNYIDLHDVKSVLEIGSAIGYSAIKMALSNPKVKIVTIERDEQRYLEGVKNIKRFGLENRITILFNDALTIKIDDKFDLIFIDAAKSQNINFFNHFEKNLKSGGTIITDNIFFHGYTYMNPEEIESKNIRGIARKIREYVEFLENNKKYKTEIKKIGDGIAVTKKEEL